MTGLAILLAVSNGRGGGDLRCDLKNERHLLLGEHIVGRWGGDKIAIIGDYHEPGDVPGYTDEQVAETGGLNQEAETDEERFNAPLIGDVPWNQRTLGEDDDVLDLGWTDISNLVVEAMHMDSYLHRSRTEPQTYADGREAPPRGAFYGSLTQGAVLEDDGTIRVATPEELAESQERISTPPPAQINA